MSVLSNRTWQKLCRLAGIASGLLIVCGSWVGEESAASDFITPPTKPGFMSGLHEIKVNQRAVEPELCLFCQNYFSRDRRMLECTFADVHYRRYLPVGLNYSPGKKFFPERIDWRHGKIGTRCPSASQFQREGLCPSEVEQHEAVIGAPWVSCPISIEGRPVTETFHIYGKNRQFDPNRRLGAQFGGDSQAPVYFAAFSSFPPEKKTPRIPVKAVKTKV